MVTPRRLLANGKVTAKLIVHLQTANGPLIDEEVTLTSDGPATITPSAGRTDAQGLFVATLTSTEVGMRTLTATSGERVLTASLTLTPPCAEPLLPTRPYVRMHNAVAGDFNQDGVLDLVGPGGDMLGGGGGGGLAGALTFASGNADGSFQPVESTRASYAATSPIAVGDFSGDGFGSSVAMAMARSPLRPRIRWLLRPHRSGREPCSRVT